MVKADGISAFKSPKRMLVRFFMSSRDKWKQKYMDAKAEIKRYKNQAADARRSRERWKAKVELLEAELASARTEAAAADKNRRRR